MDRMWAKRGVEVNARILAQETGMMELQPIVRRKTMEVAGLKRNIESSLWDVFHLRCPLDMDWSP